MRLQLEKVETSICAMKLASPTKSPSPIKFLRKESNLPAAYVGWDVDCRVEDMEERFKELKAMVNTTMTEKQGRDDALELVKTRGTVKHPTRNQFSL